MSKKDLLSIDEKLRQMPKPPFDKEKSEKIYSEIVKFHHAWKPKSEGRKRVNRWGIRLASLSAVLLIAFFAFNYFVLPGKDTNSVPTQILKQPRGQSSGTINTENLRQDVVKKWAEGVMGRDAKLQFDQFSPKLQEKYQPQFEESHWSTGTSSPWVKSYVITGGEPDSSGNPSYKVVFHMATSTGDAGDMSALVFLEKINGKWVIEKTSSSTNYLRYDLTSSEDALNPDNGNTQKSMVKSDPEKVVDQWAEGVKNRDGKGQFNMLSGVLQNKYKNQFVEWHWSPGVSSPWVKDFTIQEDNAAQNIFYVTFNMTTSAAGTARCTPPLTWKKLMVNG